VPSVGLTVVASNRPSGCTVYAADPKPYGSQAVEWNCPRANEKLSGIAFFPSCFMLPWKVFPSSIVGAAMLLAANRAIATNATATLSTGVMSTSF